MNNELSRTVQMQFMRPAELQAAGEAFPVVYVPFGLIEWHGRHLPLGNDALKAHAILVRCAETVGGVVYPSIYFHNGFDDAGHFVPVLTMLFEQLKATGFRAIIGVSGHDVQDQVDMIGAALEPVTRDGAVAGAALLEMTLSQCAESNTDHAAKWETSNMMCLYPDCVDLSTLGDDEIVCDGNPPHGISGLDPREHASAAVGEKNIRLCAEAIGRKAHELLQGLPDDCREFNQTISPESWWYV